MARKNIDNEETVLKSDVPKSDDILTVADADYKLTVSTPPFNL